MGTWWLLVVALVYEMGACRSFQLATATGDCALLDNDGGDGGQGFSFAKVLYATCLNTQLTSKE